MPWNPDRYALFKAERSAPFEDLLRLVRIRPGLRVIDLGCGTGELTYRLADHLPDSAVVGIDTSPEMLERTTTFTRPGLTFGLRSIEEITGEWDLVFSNSALQWVPEHDGLLPRLYERLRPGGQLAIQMPSNHGHLTHTLIEEIAGQAPFQKPLGGWVRVAPVLTIDEYARAMYELGAQEIVVFEKVYPHVLESADALADWTSGTALVPYFERLGKQLSEQFMEIYRHRLREIFPEHPVFYGFRRILISAVKPVD